MTMREEVNLDAVIGEFQHNLYDAARMVVGLREQLAAAAHEAVSLRASLDVANECHGNALKLYHTERHRAETAERERDVLQKLAVLQDAWETEAMGDIAMLLRERNEYRHRAERMGRVCEAARAIKEAVNIQYLDGELSRIGHADSLLFVALDREVRTLDDASAGES